MAKLLNSNVVVIITMVVAIGMATTMIFLRMKKAQKPLSIKRICLPPVFMSTGAFMYVIPQFQLPLIKISESILLGIVFSLLIIITTKYKVDETGIYLLPSKAFVIVLLVLFLLRIVLKFFAGSTMDYGEMTGMFFLLALVMIVSWRTVMLFQFIQLKRR